jgi:hypothetical protein
MNKTNKQIKEEIIKEIVNYYYKNNIEITPRMDTIMRRTIDVSLELAGRK